MTKYITYCSHVAQIGGVCVRHGAKRKTSRHGGCTDKAKTGERHGATMKRRLADKKDVPKMF